MKRILVMLTVILILVPSSTFVLAESPALLTTTMIRGGLGITAKIKNTGNMTATNITCSCLIAGSVINRTTTIVKSFPKIEPKKELTLHFIFFFIGAIRVGVGASDYFNGVEQDHYNITSYDAFAFGPFVKMLQTP